MAELGAPGARTTLYQSEDMIAILNARGTVLLNSAFAGLYEQVEIVKLAMLAVDLYHGRVSNLDLALGT